MIYFNIYNSDIRIRLSYNVQFCMNDIVFRAEEEDDTASNVG